MRYFILLALMFILFPSLSFAISLADHHKCGNYNNYNEEYEELAPQGDNKFNKTIGGSNVSFYKGTNFNTSSGKFRIFVPSGIMGVNFRMSPAVEGGNVYISMNNPPDISSATTSYPPTHISEPQPSSNPAHYNDINGGTYRYDIRPYVKGAQPWTIIKYNFYALSEDGVWIYFDVPENFTLDSFNVSYTVAETSLYNAWSNSCFDDFVYEGISEDSTFKSLNPGLTFGNSILFVGAALAKGQDKIAETVSKNTEMQIEYMEDLFKGLGLAKQKAQNVRDYGEASIPYSTCEDGPQNMTKVKSSERKFREKLIADIETRHTRRGALNELREFDLNSDLGSTLSPVVSTLSIKELERAKKQASFILDPMPVVDLPETFDSGAKRNMDNLQKVRKSKLAAPTAAISQVVSAYAPVGENTQRVMSSLEKRGEDTTESGTENIKQSERNALESKIQDGGVSIQAVSDLFVEDRFSNDKWVENIHLQSTTGLFRELRQIKAYELDKGLRDLEKLNLMAIMLAQSFLTEPESKSKDLEYVRDRALQDGVMEGF